MHNNKILISILDWGLGHATRSSVICGQLEEHGFKILIASQGLSLEWLKLRHPNAVFYELPSYQIQYQSRFMVFNILQASPYMYKAIQKEHRIIEDICRREQPLFLISDNRYGAFAKGFHSIFMGHQMQIRTGAKLLDFSANQIQRYFLKNFDEIWVPDQKSPQSLAGKLSEYDQKKVFYLGWLSRFNQKVLQATEGSLLFILSGPEPQRTRFEEIILNQLDVIKKPVVLVRGLSREHADVDDTYKRPNLTTYNLVDTETLKELIQFSEVVISRSGYSSLMDYACMQLKRVVLVPTPGQTEQIYLSQICAEKKVGKVVEQDYFKVETCLESWEGIEGFPIFEQVVFSHDFILNYVKKWVDV